VNLVVPTTSGQLLRALTLRDLSDPAQGPHAMQILLDDVVHALRRSWTCTVSTVRTPAVVSVRDNYDRLGYAPDDVTRAGRHTRYLSPKAMLRTHTSANIPHALDQYRDRHRLDELIVVPGLVHRRDVVDRTHVGAPHQVDLWRLRSEPDTTDEDLLAMIEILVGAVLPKARWRTSRVAHPYTEGGRQIDVWHDGDWLELAECGRIHPDVLRRSELDPQRWSGLALGMGLERALMLRKGIPDIRYPRSTESRIAAPMQDLEPWRAVSMLPAIRRDLSVVIDEATDDETIGDTVRATLGPRCEDVESTVVLARTRHDDLPSRVRERLGTRPGQVNALVRLTLRPLEHTLTDEQANQLRNEVYQALHLGPHLELAQETADSVRPTQRRSR
jgi:phenylalanyl-tRNA synthetase alpha chain